MENENKRSIRIGKIDIEVIEKELNQSELLFYPENPRVFSVLNSDGEPSQAEIESYMIKQDHVKTLKNNIQQNGGLIDPIIVKGNVVLEGNSRLAAYRILCKTDPVQWAKIRCFILPDDTDDSTIFALLGTYHIIGKKDWNPFEQAGYLYRRQHECKKPIEAIADELGMKAAEAKRFVEVFQAMKDNDDVEPSQWSYYEELLKSRSIKTKAAANPESQLIEKIETLIKEKKVGEAKDIRKIAEIAKTDGKVADKALKDLAEQKIDVEEAYSKVVETGKTDAVYKQAKRFREMISSPDFVEMMRDNENLHYTIDKIFKELNKAIKKFDSIK